MTYNNPGESLLIHATRDRGSVVDRLRLFDSQGSIPHGGTEFLSPHGKAVGASRTPFRLQRTVTMSGDTPQLPARIVSLVYRWREGLLVRVLLSNGPTQTTQQYGDQLPRRGGLTAFSRYPILKRGKNQTPPHPLFRLLPPDI
jgi:hypothetical protein